MAKIKSLEKLDNTIGELENAVKTDKESVNKATINNLINEFNNVYSLIEDDLYSYQNKIEEMEDNIVSLINRDDFLGFIDEEF